jgi:hypothetical protein
MKWNPANLWEGISKQNGVMQVFTIKEKKKCNCDYILFFSFIV